MVAIPWKFESSYAHHTFKSKELWGCSSVGRALRSQCRGREFESHQLHHPSPKASGGRPSKQKSIVQSLGAEKQNTKSWGYGGMVDAEDLKSFDHCDRVGSSPTIPTKNLNFRKGGFFVRFLDVWLSWLEHYVHIVGVGGSSPPTSTKNKNGFLTRFLFLSGATKNR